MSNDDDFEEEDDDDELEPLSELFEDELEENSYFFVLFVFWTRFFCYYELFNSYFLLYAFNFLLTYDERVASLFGPFFSEPFFDVMT